MDHVDDALAGAPGHFLPVAIGGGDRRRARKLHAEGFGERVHRRRRAHRVAIAGRGRRGGDELDEAGIVDLTGRHHFAGLPDDGARARPLAPEPAIQHGSDRECDRRNVDRRRRHETGRRRLVATDGQNDAVERIAVEEFYEAEISEVAVERGGRPLAGLLDRMDREFENDAAGVANALAHPFGEFEMVAIAGRQVRAGLGDADDRLAGLQLLLADPEIEIALQIEGRHVGIGGVVEPGARAQLIRGLGRHDILGRCRISAIRRPAQSRRLMYTLMIGHANALVAQTARRSRGVDRFGERGFFSAVIFGSERITRNTRPLLYAYCLSTGPKRVLSQTSACRTVSCPLV